MEWEGVGEEVYIYPPIPPPFTILLRKQEFSDCYFFGQEVSE